MTFRWLNDFSEALKNLKIFFEKILKKYCYPKTKLATNFQSHNQKSIKVIYL